MALQARAPAEPATKRVLALALVGHRQPRVAGELADRVLVRPPTGASLWAPRVELGERLCSSRDRPRAHERPLSRVRCARSTGCERAARGLASSHTSNGPRLSAHARVGVGGGRVPLEEVFPHLGAEALAHVERACGIPSSARVRAPQHACAAAVLSPSVRRRPEPSVTATTSSPRRARALLRRGFDSAAHGDEGAPRAPLQSARRPSPLPELAVERSLEARAWRLEGMRRPVHPRCRRAQTATVRNGCPSMNLHRALAAAFSAPQPSRRSRVTTRSP